MGLIRGLVLRSTGSWYDVRDSRDGHIWQCRLKGKFKALGLKVTNPIAVGDYVDFEIENEGENFGIIHEIVPRENYVMPVTLHAQLHEVFSSDAQMHGGTGDWHNPIPLVCAGKPKLRLPPLGAVFFRVEEIAQEGQRAAT